MDLTDHFPVCLVIENTMMKNIPSTTQIRIHSQRGRETFKILLLNLSIQETTGDLNVIFDNYYGQVLKAYDISFPLTNMAIKQKSVAPWMTVRLKRCIDKKSKLYKSYLKGRISKLEYTQYKNKLTNLVSRVKALYYARLFLENASNSKKIWNILNDLLKGRPVSTLKELMVDGVILKGNALMTHINKYFINIAANLCVTVPDGLVFRCLAPPVLASCFFRPTNALEVSEILRRLKNKGSRILDIHPSVVKENIIIFSNHFTLLYNMSLVTKIFPDLMKIARVSPAFKSGDSDILDNYRPISSLSVFSKVFERLTLNRILSFLSINKILTQCQFGFRKGCDITQAVVRLTTQVVNAFHDKIYCACFFLDLRKAFDTVCHVLLFKKLEHYGFRGSCLDYLKSYYHNRKQYVYSNGFSSESSSVVCGVPQGSILGPICFSLYINDMPFAIKVDVVLFADDAAFIITCPTLEGLFEKIKELFHDLSAYLNMNRLIPNSKKCKLMMFNSCPTPALPDILFYGEKN